MVPHVKVEEKLQALADRVTIIRSGRAVKTGSLAELRRDTRVAVHALTRTEPALMQHTSTLSGLESSPADGYVDTNFKVDPNELDQAVGELHRAGIHALTVTPPSLDELFLENYRAGSAAATSDGDDEAAPPSASGDHPGGVQR